MCSRMISDTVLDGVRLFVAFFFRYSTAARDAKPDDFRSVALSYPAMKRRSGGRRLVAMTTIQKKWAFNSVAKRSGQSAHPLQISKR
ncbi:unnamed protein product [Linum trigynum]|uniref:Secreted protein n=1 Tax=Linum trigynum TaxID=586398 RepID=A0AAV2GLT2_9ROSI